MNRSGRSLRPGVWTPLHLSLEPYPITYHLNLPPYAWRHYKSHGLRYIQGKTSCNVIEYYIGVLVDNRKGQMDYLLRLNIFLTRENQKKILTTPEMWRKDKVESAEFYRKERTDAGMLASVVAETEKFKTLIT